MSVLRRRGWLIGALVAALLVGQLPMLLAACCAPPGATGFGTVWFVNDFAQYESAMRQGAAQPGWLIHDPFTPEPHQATFMFPLYVGLGKLAATVHVSPVALERLVELVSRALLVVALWRFCCAFARGRAAARWAFALTLFGGGFELVAALAGGGLYSGNWSYETNSFGLLFAAPHVPLAMAATLELARAGLRPQRRLPSPARLVGLVLLGGAIALLHPFHAPVVLGAIFLAAIVFWRSGRGQANIAVASAPCIGALPVLWPTVSTFSFDPFWVSTYSMQNQLPSPLPHELLIDLGPALMLAVVGAIWLRGRVAPFGLLLWLLLALIAMYVPVPYQRRLGFGIQPAVAVLAANTLVALARSLAPRRAAALRLGVAALAGSGTVLLVTSMVAASVSNGPLPIYRATRDLDAAAAWLDGQAQPGEVIVSDWTTANYLAPRTPARVYGGHPVATLRPAEKQFAIATVFAHDASSVLVAQGIGAHWLVYGPAEASLSGPASPAFQSGAVRVYRVPHG